MKKTMKHFLSAFLSVCLLFGLVSCNIPFFSEEEEMTKTTTEIESGVSTEGDNSEEVTDTTSPDEGDKKPGNEEEDKDVLKVNSSTAGIKLLGKRAVVSDSQINCDWSGSGIEFSVFLTDRTVSLEVQTDGPCYFRAYVDGAEWKTLTGSVYHQVSGGKGVINLTGLTPAKQHTIRIVRVTDAMFGTAAITKIKMTGVLQTTVLSDSNLYIEFVGDAETVGMGKIASGKNDYTAEDITLAYSYQLAQCMNAEYSVVAQSSSLPLSLNGELALGLYQLAAPNRDDSAVYDFAKKPNVVVVNLGTDDFTNCGEDGVSAEAFAIAYESLIRLIAEKNGTDCRIVCVYDNAWGDFATAISTVVSKLGGQNAGVYTCQRVAGEDGVLDATEQATLLVALQSAVNNALNGVITERELDTETNGDGLDVSYDDFVTLT